MKKSKILIYSPKKIYKQIHLLIHKHHNIFTLTKNL
jgi:hypothetical protein